MNAPVFWVRQAAAAGLLAAGLAAGLLATGCSAAGQPGAARKPASHLTNGPSVSPVQAGAGKSPASARPASPSPAPAASSTGERVAAAGPGKCPATGLKVTIGTANGATGSIYYPLDFTNSSGATCNLYGYPGVGFVTAPAGLLIGAPAVRNPAFAPELVSLPPGATAHASLQVQVAQSYSARLCKPVTAHWLQIYPPGSYAALFVPFTAVTCTGRIPSRSTLGIYVVRPGATGP